MDDLIKRSDAIEAVSISCGTCLARDSEDCEKCSVPKLRELVNAIPSAERPQEVIAQVTFEEEKLREIVKEAVERFKEEYEIVDRPQGKWKPFDLTWGRSIYACSVCEEAIAVPCGWSSGKPIYDYCPMCGAKMKGADDE